MQFRIAMLARKICLQAAATTTPTTTVYVFTMCQFIALFWTQMSFVQVKAKYMKVDMIHFIQIMHPELPQEMRSMLPWWPVAEDSQAVNSMEVFTWLINTLGVVATSG